MNLIQYMRRMYLFLVYDLCSSLYRISFDKHEFLIKGSQMCFFLRIVLFVFCLVRKFSLTQGHEFLHAKIFIVLSFIKLELTLSFRSR